VRGSFTPEIRNYSMALQYLRCANSRHLACYGRASALGYRVLSCAV
jgi:hypothetical protein